MTVEIFFWYVFPLIVGAAAFGWIATLEASHGVTVSNLTALKSPEGGLDLQVSFRQAVR